MAASAQVGAGPPTAQAAPAAASAASAAPAAPAADRAAPPSSAEPGSPAPPAEEPEFDVFEYVVEGNSVLPAELIERAVTPYLGPKRRIADVEAARKALEEAYQNRGFQTVFVDVPEQKVDAGSVRLRVLQGRVERLRITGSRFFSLGQIRSAVPELAAGNVPDFSVVQAQLASLNRSADRAVTPVLRQGRTPGSVEVELVVRDQLPLHGDVELNNRSSAFTSETRLAAGLRWENLWQSLHSAGLSVQTSPEATDEVKVLVANYLWRLPASTDAWSFYAVRSDSKVALVGSSTVLGKASIAGVRRVIGLPTDAGSTSFDTLTLGLDYKRFGQTNIATATQTADVLPALDYVPLSLAFASASAGEGRSTQWSITAVSAPAHWLGNKDAEFAGRRFVARAGWLALKFDTTLERALGPRGSLWLRVDGQWSDDPLVSNEQFTVGGAESVRGYREAELAGDRGARAAFEWRVAPWRAAPKDAGVDAAAAPRTAARWYAGAQAYALLDVGAVETVQPLGPQVARRWIGGLGAGLRWSLAGWRLQLEAARALNPGASGVGGYVTDKGDWRVHARAAWEF